VFVNDAWQVNRHFTANLGLRFDKNNGKDAAGQLVANDSAWSPRLGVVWDPRGDGRWAVNASYGRYVAALANSIADASSPAGTPAIIAYFYEGPTINLAPTDPLVPSDVALRTIFDWFNANGGTSMSPFFVDIPGTATRILDSLTSPHADEVSIGVSRTLGTRGALRADFVHRKYGGFYSERVDTTTGTATDEAGQVFDLNVLENTDAVRRKYDALNLQATYRVSTRINAGGTYTLSKLFGNVNGENVGSGPLTTDVLSYPEYFDRAWSFPEGNLAADQRHRLRLWSAIELPAPARWGRMSVGLIEQIESGTPFGAIGAVSTTDFVENPGYQTPPETVSYFFTPRDEFRTDTMYRTDVSFNYSHALPGARRGEIFASFHLLNAFNQFQLFDLTGNAINTSVLTAFDDPDRFATFNPFTETPVRGVHWDTDENFGKAIGASAYTLPRTFRMSVGIRF
jgi:hypothetical protein